MRGAPEQQSTVFPAGTYAAATWSIPLDYGGMTSALLRRSRAFAQEAGVEVRVLTLDPGLDVERTRTELAARGELVPGVTLHNLWHDLRTLGDDEIAPSRRAVPAARERAEAGERERAVRDADGEVVRRLHFRPDGSLAAVDGREWGRRVTLFTRDGRQGRSWRSVSALYRWWLETVLPARPATPAYLVVDSKELIKDFASVRRRDLYTVHVVHGTHLSTTARDARGPLTATRTPLIERLDDFDAVVFLTESQRADVLERVGPRQHAYVVPNSTALPATAPPIHADRNRGAVLARLNGRKRVGHAIEAVRRAGRTGSDVRLDVFGDGPSRARLEARAARAPGVRLHGFVPDAADRLVDASFLVLTSRSEGLPLVFAEAMARGCVPISYDVRYGPADMITDGVDGFLVPDGDVDALASTITRFVTLDDEAMSEMRRAAVATAQGYSDAAVVARWAEVFADLARRRRRTDLWRSSWRSRLRFVRRGSKAVLRQGAGMLRRAAR